MFHIPAASPKLLSTTFFLYLFSSFFFILFTLFLNSLNFLQASISSILQTPWSMFWKARSLAFFFHWSLILMSWSVFSKIHQHLNNPRPLANQHVSNHHETYQNQNYLLDLFRIVFEYIGDSLDNLTKPIMSWSLLPKLSIIGWEHLNLTLVYMWSMHETLVWFATELNCDRVTPLTFWDILNRLQVRCTNWDNLNNW